MEGRVTIVGLGCVGSSIGLALREKDSSVEVIGHDIEAGNTRLAKRMGAVTKTHWNLPAACEGSSLVILALPLPALLETLELLGPHLDEGCVVTDTASLKASVLECAGEHLPDTVHFIGGMPVPGPASGEGRALVGPEAARADLFDGGVYCITPDADTSSHATGVLTELAETLGAQPLFLDAAEHDGLQAGVGGLPALISVALLRATMGTPGWAEMRKVAGQDYSALTSPAATNPGDRLGTVLANHDNVMRRLDMFIAELLRIRDQFVDGDTEGLEAVFSGATDAHARWINERLEGTWEDLPEMGDMLGPGDQISRMFVGNLFSRRPPLEDEEE